MFYYKGLEEIIFSKHELLSDSPDELIIISGYLGPAPIERLSELPKMQITVIGGMYPSGIDVRLHRSLEKIQEKNQSLTIKYTEQEIHSKIYIWKRNGKILSALIGSANFSSNGLRTDYRESLTDAMDDTFSSLDEYYNFILDHSSEIPIIDRNQKMVNIPNSELLVDAQKKFSAEIPLYSIKGKKETVPPSSGLNWGLARLGKNKSHVAPGDAYIRLPKEIIKTNPSLFKALDPKFSSPVGERKRNSEPIELIWDDGTVMEASLEGSQKYNGKKYPKQLASFSSSRPRSNISKKSILGRYIRHRLNVGIDEVIKLSTLEDYGRTTITLSLIEDGVYYADFSVEQKNSES